MRSIPTKSITKETKKEKHVTEKQQKKEYAKKFRNFWTCARPVTQSVPNKKAYDRNREKDAIRKKGLE